MRTTLIYSGGSDSFTLLHYLRNRGYDVEAISFDYNQRHERELAYAMRECARLNVRHTTVPIPFLHQFSASSALTGRVDVPEGFYAAENMKRTVVPNRNMIMLAIAASYALNRDCKFLAYGAHAGDHDIYPDCRAEFIAAMGVAFKLCDWKSLELLVPFIAQDKRDIYKWGLEAGLNYANAWTCYKGDAIACGRCGSCVERLHAFHDLATTDPMQYEDREYFKTVIPQ